MASFCPKCGLAISPETRFCGGCGSPVNAAAAGTPAATTNLGVSQGQPAYTTTPAPAYTTTPAPAYPPSPVYRQPVATASSGGGALKIILIVVAVIILLGVLFAMVVGFGIWRATRAVHINHSGNGVTLSTPGGTIVTGGGSTVSALDLGTVVYPGATRAEGGMQFHTAHGSMVTMIYTTSDPVSKVADFYKAQFGADNTDMTSGDGEIVSSGGNDKDHVMVTISPGDSTDGKTKFVIMHTTKQ